MAAPPPHFDPGLGALPSGQLGASNMASLQAALERFAEPFNQSSGEVDFVSGAILEHVRGRVCDLAKTQFGSRFLQDRLGGDNDPRYAAMIYNECLANLPELMVNLFGTYLCQKLMECCNQVQRTALWRRLRADLINIGCDRQGSRIVQRMITISASDPEHRQIVMTALSQPNPSLNQPHSEGYDLTLALLRNVNGTHVAHACLDQYPPPECEPFMRCAFRNVGVLGIDRCGLAILKKCLHHADRVALPMLSWMVEQVIVLSDLLLTDPFGNYLMQFIVEMPIARTRFAGALANRLRGQLPAAARHQCATHVVEKLIRAASAVCSDPTAIPSEISEAASIRDAIVSEIWGSLRIGGPNQSETAVALEECLHDPHGNHILLVAFEFASRFHQQQLASALHPLLRHSPSIKRSIHQRWERMIAEPLSSSFLATDVKMPSQPHRSGSMDKMIPSDHAALQSSQLRELISMVSRLQDSNVASSKDDPVSRQIQLVRQQLAVLLRLRANPTAPAAAPPSMPMLSAAKPPTNDSLVGQSVLAPSPNLALNAFSTIASSLPAEASPIGLGSVASPTAASQTGTSSSGDSPRLGRGNAQSNAPDGSGSDSNSVSSSNRGRANRAQMSENGFSNRDSGSSESGRHSSHGNSSHGSQNTGSHGSSTGNSSSGHSSSGDNSSGHNSNSGSEDSDQEAPGQVSPPDAPANTSGSVATATTQPPANSSASQDYVRPNDNKKGSPHWDPRASLFANQQSMQFLHDGLHNWSELSSAVPPTQPTWQPLHSGSDKWQASGASDPTLPQTVSSSSPGSNLTGAPNALETSDDDWLQQQISSLSSENVASLIDELRKLTEQVDQFQVPSQGTSGQVMQPSPIEAHLTYRPESAPQYNSYSYPSGHAAMQRSPHQNLYPQPHQPHQQTRYAPPSFPYQHKYQQPHPDSHSYHPTSGMHSAPQPNWQQPQYHHQPPMYDSYQQHSYPFHSSPYSSPAFPQASQHRHPAPTQGWQRVSGTSHYPNHPPHQRGHPPF